MAAIRPAAGGRWFGHCRSGLSAITSGETIPRRENVDVVQHFATSYDATLYESLYAKPTEASLGSRPSPTSLLGSKNSESLYFPLTGSSPGGLAPHDTARWSESSSLQQRRVHKHMQHYWPKLSNVHEVAAGGNLCSLKLTVTEITPPPALLQG